MKSPSNPKTFTSHYLVAAEIASIDKVVPTEFIATESQLKWHELEKGNWFADLSPIGAIKCVVVNHLQNWWTLSVRQGTYAGPVILRREITLPDSKLIAAQLLCEALARQLVKEMHERIR